KGCLKSDARQDSCRVLFCKRIDPSPGASGLPQFLVAATSFLSRTPHLLFTIVSSLSKPPQERLPSLSSKASCPLVRFCLNAYEAGDNLANTFDFRIVVNPRGIGPGWFGPN